MPSTPSKATIEEGRDQAAICDSEDAGQAHEVPGDGPMMFGDRPEIIAIIVLIVLLAIIGCIIFEAWR